MVLDSDSAGDNLLHSIIKYMKEAAIKVFFKPMPRGIKDVNTLHCTTCHKDIEVFKRIFDNIGQVPATLKGFEILHDMIPDLELLTRYNIDNYIRHVIGDNKIEIDKFIQALYLLQGKDQGISKTTIRDVARNTIQTMEEQAQEETEILAQGLGDKLIAEGDNSYLYQRVTMTGVIFEPFTSFKVKVLKREMTESGTVISIWRLENEDGRVHEIEVGPEERASAMEFMKAVNMVNGFLYRVPPIAGFHNMFVYYIEKDIACPLRARFNAVGKYKDVWLFDEFGISKNGGICPLDNGIYSMDGVNYLPPAESMTKDLYRVKVNMPQPTQLRKEEVIGLLRLLEKNQGSKVAWIILGWIAACFGRDYILEQGIGFPVCYITGNAQSGKTTLAKWLLRAAGFRNPTALGAKSSVFGINVLASVYGNLPLWFDDIRNLGEEGIWNTVILGAYENAGDVKGTVTRTLSANMEYKSGFLITSEFFIKSPAAQSRCISLVVDDTMQDRTVFNDINGAVDRVLPYLGINTIVKMQTGGKDFMAAVWKYREMLSQKGVNSRFSQNYAVVLAGFCVMFEDYIEETDDIFKEIVEYIVSMSESNDLEVASGSYAQELVKDIATIMLDRQYKDIYKQGEDWIIRNNKLYFKTAGLYDLWRRYKGVNNTGDYNTRREFVAQMRRLSYAERNTAGTVMINNKRFAGICLDLDKMKEVKDVEINLIPDLLSSIDVSEFI